MEIDQDSSILNNLLNDTFSYQIDIIVPNSEKIFDQIKPLFKRYFLLTKIRLDELISKDFLNAFINNGNIYLHSFNTKLDCNDCVCLLPNGTLVLNVTCSTNEKIPVEYSKKTVKSAGFDKYELSLSLEQLLNQKNYELIKNIFQTMLFSFYAYFEPNDSNINSRELLIKYFGANRVINCLNRLDSRVYDCSKQTLEKYFLKSDLKNEENWLEVENLIGYFINNSDLDNLISKNSNDKSQNSKISILRVKGFLPNKLVKIILEENLESLIDPDNEINRVLVKLHGFRDSPVSLVRLNHNLNNKTRINEENFVTICLESNEKSNNLICYFKDFNKIYSINK